MKFNVIGTNEFDRSVKRLAKRYASLRTDLAVVVSELADNPTMGTSIGKNCYKIRIAIASKGKGKRGGARLITLVRIQHGNVFLMDIYDKSDRANITDNELQALIDGLPAVLPITNTEQQTSNQQ